MQTWSLFSKPGFGFPEMTGTAKAGFQVFWALMFWVSNAANSLL